MPEPLDPLDFRSIKLNDDQFVREFLFHKIIVESDIAVIIQLLTELVAKSTGKNADDVWNRADKIRGAKMNDIVAELRRKYEETSQR